MSKWKTGYTGLPLRNHRQIHMIRSSSASSQSFSELSFVRKAKNLQELYEYSIACFKVRYLRIHLGEVPELTLKMCEGPLVQMEHDVPQI